MVRQNNGQLSSQLSKLITKQTSSRFMGKLTDYWWYPATGVLDDNVDLNYELNDLLEIEIDRSINKET